MVMESDDRLKRIHETERAAQARALLQNAMFNAAFEAVEQELMTRWKQDATLQADGRERVFLMVTLLGQIKRVLTTHIETGQMAEMQLQQDRKERSRLADLATGLRSMMR